MASTSTTRLLGQAALGLSLSAGLFAACGSDDGKKKSPRDPFGEAGEGAGGGSSSPGAAGAPASRAGEGPITAGASGVGAQGGAGGTEPVVNGGAGGKVDEMNGGAGGASPAEAGGGGASQSGAGASGTGGAEPEPVQVFTTITALYDAIDDASLEEGDAWRVEWQGDARVAAGSIAGDLLQGVPSPHVLDQGELPLKLFEAIEWEHRGGVAGSLTFDGDGYPSFTLATNANAGASAAAILNRERYAFRRFSRARARMAQDLTGAAAFSGLSLQLTNADLQTRLIGNHFVEAGGATQSVAIDYYNAGTQVLTNGVGTSPHDRVFEGFWNLVVADPASPSLTVTMQLQTMASVSLGQDSSGVAGQGDWSQDTGPDYAAMFSLYRQAGGSGTSSAVAVSLEVDRYVP